MNLELQKSLAEKHPQILRDLGGDPMRTCMAWGLECDNGWHSLIDTLLEKLQCVCNLSTAGGSPIAIVADQVKEKFGTLCFYYHTEGASPIVASIVSDIVSSAESRSSQVCETCGSHATLCKRGGWLKTLCRDCAIKSGYSACDKELDEYWRTSTSPETGSSDEVANPPPVGV